MRKLLMILALCLLPGLALAQTASPSPAITITPPKVEMKGITTKQVLIVAAVMVAGAVVGDILIGDMVGGMISGLAGAAAGFFIGTWVAQEEAAGAI